MSRFLSTLYRRPRRQKPSYPKMGRWTRSLRDQRIRGFLNPVVYKPVGVALAFDQSLADRFPESQVDLVSRFPENY